MLELFDKLDRYVTGDATVGIIGYGAFGFAMSVAISENVANIIAYERNAKLCDSVDCKRLHTSFPNVEVPHNVRIVKSLGDMLEASVILLCIPAQDLREVVNSLKDVAVAEDTLHRLYKIPMVVCSKGIENSSLKLMTDVILDVIPRHTAICVLSGPSFASEIVHKKPTIVNFGCMHAHVGLVISELLMHKDFVLGYCNDVCGMQICGAVKNVIAIAAGIMKGLEMGSGACASLLSKALSEMSKLVEAMGGNRKTVLLPVGVGDLILTSSSTLSRNTKFGLDIVTQHKKIDELINGVTIEGYYTALALHKFCYERCLNLPIINAVHSVLYEGANPELAIREAVFSKF